MAGVTYLGERRRASDGRPTERYSDFTRDREITARIQTVSRRFLATVSLVRDSYENGGRRQAAAGGGCNHRNVESSWCFFTRGGRGMLVALVRRPRVPPLLHRGLCLPVLLLPAISGWKRDIPRCLS